MDDVISRIEYAQPGVKVVVDKDGKELTLKEYADSLAPIIYRITYGESVVTGNIYVMDCIENGQLSEIHTFYTSVEIEEFIHRKQINDDYYYIYAIRPRRLNLDARGIEFHRMDKTQLNIKRLSNALSEERKKRNSKYAKTRKWVANLDDKGNFDVKTLYETDAQESEVTAK